MPLKTLTSMVPPVEHYSEDFLELVQQLNLHVQKAGVRIEGNYFYGHNHTQLSTQQFHKGTEMRSLLLQAIENKRHILEIGLNAGHSALAILYHNRMTELHSVDINQHPYVSLAADFLQAYFGARFKFYPGNSLVVLPRLAVMYPEQKFDLIHIDGGHTKAAFETDVFNSLRLVQEPGWLLLDDVTIPSIKPSVQHFIERKLIEPVHYGDTRNMLVRVQQQSNLH